MGICRCGEHGANDLALADDLGTQLAANFHGYIELHLHRGVRRHQSINLEEDAGATDVCSSPFMPKGPAKGSEPQRQLNLKSLRALWTGR